MKGEPPPSRFGRLRRLTQEEIELWLHVTRNVSPRPGRTWPAELRPEPIRAEPSNAGSAQSGPVSEEPPPPATVSRPPALPRLMVLNRRQRQKLARGKASVDAAIDLHGMRQQEAHVALHRFLLRAQRDAAKVVLVVTGKGTGRDEAGLGDAGVLRRSVPLWLRAPEWRSLVVGFEEASRQHGGAGALYVRLRRHDRAAGERRGM